MILKVLKIGPTYGKYIKGNYELKKAMSVYSNNYFFAGCMWSVCGIHDQGWAERPVFGKIRYMNYNGCKRKFDVIEFVRRYGATKSRAELAQIPVNRRRKTK